MRVVIGGYVPEEGRVSMMRTAHSIARHAEPLLDPGDSISLQDPRGEDHLHRTGNARATKLKKRLSNPARLGFFRADVIHLVDSDHAYGIAPWNFRRTVVTCHDLMPFLLDPTLETVFGGRLGRYFYRRALANLARCAHVVCVSEFTRQTLFRWSACDASRTSVIPQAVEAHFRPLAPDDPALDAFKVERGLAGRRVVLHVGSCLAYKNIGGLLAVFGKLVANSGEDLVLLKVGGHFSEDERAFIGRHGLERRVVHCTNLSEAALVLAYNAADLLLWPSFFEGFGLPVLEAMACGTPVVCSNGGALAEVAGDRARVHAAEDVAGMAESCRAILGEGELAGRMREAGLAYARTFSWERAARAYCGLYREVAGAP